MYACMVKMNALSNANALSALSNANTLSNVNALSALSNANTLSNVNASSAILKINANVQSVWPRGLWLYSG